jgi:cytochrome c-type biogenesis protein CcmF
MAPAVFLMGVGPVASWKEASLPALWTRLRWALGARCSPRSLIPLMLGRVSLPIAIGLWLGLLGVFATGMHAWQRLKTAPQSTLPAKLGAQPLAWYGMMIAHLGVAAFIFGVTLVKGYEHEKDLRMAPGERTTLGGYEFTFKGTKEVKGPNYTAMQGEFEVRRAGSTQILRTMQPEKRVYNASGQTMTEADIDTGILRDLYVSLGEPVDDNAWGVRVYYKPFVDWIWGGCFLMALGGFFALSDRRYRMKRAATAIAPGLSPVHP